MQLPFFYHLVFESNHKANALNRLSNEDYFFPSTQADIFSASLPDHTFQSFQRRATQESISNRAVQHTRSASLNSNNNSIALSEARKEAVSRSKWAAAIPPTPLKSKNTISKSLDAKAAPKLSGAEESTTKTQHLDYRLGFISIESINISIFSQPTNDMHEKEGVLGRSRGKSVIIADSVGDRLSATKARYEPISTKNTDFGYGVVHLYRDKFATPGPYNIDRNSAQHTSVASPSDNRIVTGSDIVKDQETKEDVNEITTVAILAVPSYMTPSDFLGFVGEDTKDAVSHFRLIKTGESSRRYMALMKFKTAPSAKKFIQEYNGKVFNSMEPENCHVVFIKSILFTSDDTSNDNNDVGRSNVAHSSQDNRVNAYPDISNDPFAPTSVPNPVNTIVESDSPPPYQPNSLPTKPAPPPTASLLELPTCPVCLERMDETTGLLTIQCQHVFHCACLSKWKDGSCPVCRYSSGGRASYSGSSRRGSSRGMVDGEDIDDMCNKCGAMSNLWICLICGNIGCGRYDEKHAFDHYLETSHCFAMDVESQRVWDYASDTYVHRLIQNKSDGKLVELPSNSSIGLEYDDSDYVPRQKLEKIGMEYTYLLTSQLDSQRMYFEEQVLAAADKAAIAAQRAEEAAQQLSTVMEDAKDLRSKLETLSVETVPVLERSKERAEKKAEKAAEMIRKLDKDWREEKAVSHGLMERVEVMGKDGEMLKKENEDLKEQIRDLMFFVEGRNKLLAMEEEGLEEGIVTVGEAADTSKKKKKGKGKSKK